MAEIEANKLKAAVQIFGVDAASDFLTALPIDSQEKLAFETDPKVWEGELIKHYVDWMEGDE